MSQKPGDFTAGRGLLAAAKTLNFSSGCSVGGVSSGMSGRGQEQGSGKVSSEHLGSTMKLFSSLGLSPSDLDALAQIPEDQISVETLPHILRQLKSRKSRDSYNDWDEPGPRAREGQRDREYSYRQDPAPSHSFGLNYGPSSREFSQLSRHEFGMAPPDSAGYMQKRVGQPSQGKVEDFMGVNPAMFPHVCSLCDFDVHSIMEWNQHINGLRHAETRRVLLNMYPDWEPPMAPNRSGGMDTPNLSAGILGPAPMSGGQSSGLSSGWGGGAGLSGMNPQGHNMRSRVVTVKYERKPLSNKSLFNFVEPFGQLREHLLLKNKAFLEMSTHNEALDVVNYYQQNPASLGGRPLVFELSKRLVIEKQEHSNLGDRPMDRPIRDLNPNGSQVVYFSNLPREEEKKRDLLTIAGRFGTVEKHLFLAEEGFVQLGSPRDAEMMVKYYSMNPLVVRGRPIRLNICAKYKTLNLVKRQGQGRRPDGRGDGRGDGGSYPNSGTRNTSGSRPYRSSSSPRRSTDKRSPSPKSRSRDDRKKEERSKPKSESKPEPKPVPVKEENLSKEDEARSSKQAQDTEERERSTEKDSQKASDADEAQEDTPEEADCGQVKGEEPEETEGAGKEDNMDDTEESVENLEADLHEDEEDFLENMDDMVVLDELPEDDGADSIDNSRKGGMRVVIVIGFRRGYNYLNELMQLAKPFGKVVRHLILDLKPKAYLQFSTQEEAVAMARFYNGNVQATICGRPVKISHYTAHPTIQCGHSRVVYVGQIPSVKFSDKDILKFAKPFGKISKFFLHPIRRECFIEMERAEDAEKMAEHYRGHPAVFHGKRLTVYVSRKYRELRGRHVMSTEEEKRPSKREKSSSPAPNQSEEPPAKKHREETPKNEPVETPEEQEWREEEGASNLEKETGENGEMEGSEEELTEEKTEEELTEERREEEPTEETEEEDEEKLLEETEEERLQEASDKEQEEEEEEEETETNQDAAQTESSLLESEAPPFDSEVPSPESKPSVASIPLPPYDPHTPLGVEHVKMGYYCRVCFLFYSNEDAAKKTHCSSKAHYDKLQKFLENEKNRSGKKKKSQ